MSDRNVAEIEVFESFYLRAEPRVTGMLRVRGLVDSRTGVLGRLMVRVLTIRSWSGDVV
jgi:hypothetical protein